KGRELRASARAAVAFYWHRLGKQVRIEGRVEEVSPAEADAYWATRPRASQLAALASEQSAALASRRALSARWTALRRRYRRRPVPRPPTCTGFRLVPASIELWTHREHRPHERELVVRTRAGWRRRLLQPQAHPPADSRAPIGIMEHEEGKRRSPPRPIAGRDRP